MARQRFIWPDLWSDPGFASLDPVAQVLYIGCFSNADDHGRLLGDVAYLRATVWPRAGSRRLGVNKARESMISAMPKLVLYEVEGVEYLAFTNWTEWQKPKYPSPSRLPPPPDGSGNRSRNGSRSDSGNDSSMGWVGIGGEEHKPQLDPKAAARSKSSSSTTEASYAEPPNPEPPQDPAAAEESPTETDIRAACTRFGADLNIVEPLARQLPAVVFAAIVTKHTLKVKRGAADDVPALFVRLLQTELKAQAKAHAKHVAPPVPTRLPEDERAKPATGAEWVRHIVPTLRRHPFPKVEEVIRGRANFEVWTDDELAERLTLARQLHQADAA